MPEIRLDRVSKYYRVEKKKTAAVYGVSLTIKQGEFVFLIGSRGAGKSSILKMLAGKISPNKGKVYFDNINMKRFFFPMKRRFKRIFGCVWQESSLSMKRTVYENIARSARAGGLSGYSLSLAVKKVLGLVDMMGSEALLPSELSEGDLRRIELACALVCSPPILLLDEPTAGLDDDATWDILHLLNDLNNRGTTVVMATRAGKYVNIMRRRVITLVDGRVARDAAIGRYGDVN